ncbi:MAG: redoxin domain-containing protein [Nitrospirae bacterium]|nr:redoxin domain-containing protein [Nitrospirota bacterium]
MTSTAVKSRTGIAVVALVIVAGAFTLIFAHGLTQDPRSIPTPLIGQPAPAFTLMSLDGKEISLSDYAGRAVVLNFWSSWCVPCRDEADLLESIAQHFKGREVNVLGVNIQDEPEAAKKFVAEEGMTFPNVVDTDGRLSIAYGVYGVPETFFVDRSGRIADKITGPVSVENFRAGLEKLAPLASHGTGAEGSNPHSVSAPVHGKMP